MVIITISNLDRKMMMKCFPGMVDLRSAGSRIFRRDHISIMPHHRDFPTRQVLITETVILSATTTQFNI